MLMIDPGEVEGKKDMQTTHSQKKESGQSLVEFSMGAIVILMLLVGVADLGRAFFTFLTIRDAAQEGAVYGAVCPWNTTKIDNRIRTTSVTPVDLSDVNHVSIECTYEYRHPVTGVEATAACGTSLANVYPKAGQAIKLRVTFDNFTVTTPLAGSLLGQTLTLRAEVIDTILRVPSVNDLSCQ
jgi:Flp pilus assembly protein TadG